MKNLVFLIYAFFFNLRALFPARPNKVGLVSMHNAGFNDSLAEVQAELSKRGGFKFVKVSRTSLKKPLAALKFCTLDAYRLGGASLIFLNDNFMPLSKLRPQKGTKIVQLWHGQGAFKKFGLAINQTDEIRQRELAANRRLTYVVCSSAGVRDIYAEAFGVDKSKVLTTGSPNEDYYFKNHNKEKLRADFDNRYPDSCGKMLVLYAPTFRETKNENDVILSHFDAFRLKNDLEKVLLKEVQILVKLHPQINSSETAEGTLNVTDYENTNELCLLSDLLITDYSSICMDFSLQNKPMIFYAYDLDDYKDSRNFYFDYETYVPGTVARNMDELCSAIISIMKPDTVKTGLMKVNAKADEFKEFNFDFPNGTATKQLLDFLL